MSINTVQPADAIAPPQRWRRRMPRRFFLGTLLLYLIVLGTYLLALTPLQNSLPNWRTVVPLLAFASFYIGAGLFLLILGRGHVSRWEVLKVIAATFILTCLLCLVLRSQQVLDTIPPSRQQLRGFVSSVADGVRRLFAGESTLAHMIEFAGMVMFEEALKLAPVFLLIALRRLRSAHDAMLCGALAGLTFGVVEAISYGYLEYPYQRAPITTYLTRFIIMAPLHGIWDALGGGLVFFLSGRWRSNSSRRPSSVALVAAYCCAVVFHIAHNSLQAVYGPAMQIVTVFALLAPLYLMSKIARRRAEALGEPQDLPFIGDLHLLMISLATAFLATSVAFAWALGPVPKPPMQNPVAPALHSSH